jgi:glyoxylase-like metal-dependent hydrolase (beta-lactamase superfamily II)
MPSGMTTAQNPTIRPYAREEAGLDDGTYPVAPDVAALKVMIVNVVFVGSPGGRWVLVDAGMPYTTNYIKSVAERRFGRSARPEAIILTHGHFDHVGALPVLADEWDVPIYAHRLEMPYITGRSAYPPPDPTVGGGMMARLSPLYPRGPYDFSHRTRALPEDGSVPGLSDWRWVFTPGHTPGHVALFRDSDRTLIAGDAFVTTKQESARGAFAYSPKKVHRPPAYYTPDWISAYNSVRKLSELRPAAAVTGHGVPVHGRELTQGLDYLVSHFREEMPRRGRYVRESAIADENGLVYVPPPVPDPVPKVLAVAGIAAVVAALVAGSARRRD